MRKIVDTDLEPPSVKNSRGNNMINRIGVWALSVVSLMVVSSIGASERIKGTFELTADCPAYRSISKQTGKVVLKAGKRYKARQKNKPVPTHYQLELTPKKLLWIPVNCGTLDGNASRTVAQSKPKPKPVVVRQKAARKPAHYLLAMSWLPGFCATHGRKKECRNARRGDYSSAHLSLHGLWPQPKDNAYCGVSETEKSIDRRGRWDLLPALKLSSKTKNELKKYMPGFSSNLQRHEWIKHGTCYSKDPETYYADSILLAKAIDKGGVDELITSLKRKKVTLKQIKRAMESSFGKGTGNSVGLRCNRKNQLTELWIGLYGDPATSSLEQMLKAGKKQYTNCRANAGSVATY